MKSDRLFWIVSDQLIVYVCLDKLQRAILFLSRSQQEHFDCKNVLDQGSLGCLFIGCRADYILQQNKYNFVEIIY